ncbi:solute carrier family 35 member G1-like [Limulus polyphemus]|uniref:Solute carrier family 35 member G1-like n=1 Tax=Limulus polyphemus TaxID=6850 RepID=A0ABM1BNS4_LIMPO|nr:solute carrier family 35 member G1-like [Limulus polyphemus]
METGTKTLKPKLGESHEALIEASMKKEILNTLSSYQNTINTSQSRTQRILKIPFLGILCALISALFFATASFIVAFVTTVDPIEIVVIRSCIQMMFCVPVIIYNQNSFFGTSGERLFLCIRAIVGTVAMGMSYYSVRLIPLADVSTIVLGSPALITLFACVFLREPCGIFQIFTIIITLTGVVLISRPSFLFGITSIDQVSSADRLQGSLMAFCSCTARALSFITMRKLQKTPIPVVIFMFSFSSITFGLLYLFITGTLSVPSCGQEAVLLVLCGLCGTFGQFLMTTALRFEEAGPVSIARTADVVLAFIFGVSFLDQYPSWTSIVGAFFVCSSFLLTAIKKWRNRSKPSHTSSSERDPLQGKNNIFYNSLLFRKSK